MLHKLTMSCLLAFYLSHGARLVCWLCVSHGDTSIWPLNCLLLFIACSSQILLLMYFIHIKQKQPTNATVFNYFHSTNLKQTHSTTHNKTSRRYAAKTYGRLEMSKTYISHVAKPDQKFSTKRLRNKHSLTIIYLGGIISGSSAGGTA